MGDSRYLNVLNVEFPSRFCAAIVKVLKAYKDSVTKDAATIVEEATIALNNLAFKNTVNQKALVGAGVCEGDGFLTSLTLHLCNCLQLTS